MHEEDQNTSVSTSVNNNRKYQKNKRKVFPSPTRLKRARLLERSLLIQEIKRGRIERYNISKGLSGSQCNENEGDTALSLFFKSIAATASTFSPQLQARAKAEVMNIISTLEVEHHSNQNQNTEDIAGNSVACSYDFPSSDYYTTEEETKTALSHLN